MSEGISILALLSTTAQSPAALWDFQRGQLWKIPEAALLDIILAFSQWVVDNDSGKPISCNFMCDFLEIRERI